MSWRYQRGLSRSLDGPIIAIYSSDMELFFDHLLQALMMAVILVVVAVPEGLPLMIAIVSAMMMRRMLKDQVLVRTNAGIETAGSLNILFTDKTGTLTKGELEVVALWQSGESATTPSKRLAETIIQTSQSEYRVESDEIIGGNSTDQALMQWIVHHPTQHHEIKPLDITKAELIAFSSARKWSAVAIPRKDGRWLSKIKGAPEMLLPLCQHYINDNGEIIAMTPEVQQEMQAMMQQWSDASMRILAFAWTDHRVEADQVLQNPLVLLGLVAIRDEVRQEAKIAVHQVQEAGVQVVMVTGDRKETALAIAKEVGIAHQDSLVLDSSQLHLLSDNELMEALPRLAVVARAMPQDKSRLVRLAQQKDLVVGMTGDGVNDAPALKSADVGFAMGSGTDVAKEAGSIIILDDNFVSIQQAILYGRTIYHNIQRFIVFQLTINMSAVLVTLFFPLVGYEPPLKITQMLWINLIMDSLAALAFGGEMALKRYLQERPKRRDEAIVTPIMLEQIIVIGLVIFGISLYLLYSLDMALFFHYGNNGVNSWSTAYFTFFVFAALANAFNVRTSELNPLANIEGNPLFWRVMIFIGVVQIFFSTFGGRALDGYGMGIGRWFIIFALSLSVFGAGLLHKALRIRDNKMA
ncbi:cation-translocating P-type ATPase (plasmid) [Entomospira nematocerorum]|nr:cation-translocating P-type ATPase [Entomospira nematocera]WDI34580.1 cation-translocating P-type ATPase [Entomospira nematocera]